MFPQRNIYFRAYKNILQHNIRSNDHDHDVPKRSSHFKIEYRATGMRGPAVVEGPSHNIRHLLSINAIISYILNRTVILSE